MEPVRTCVGCRTRAPRAALLRVVSQNDILILDERAVLPGRGAWVHPTPECVDAALRRRAFGRALRVSSDLDTRIIEQHPPRNKG
ncbi:nucleic-acid-binding protein [Microbacterium sp. 1.5R]|uniref:YlxR family protein n=1 Tax=Microbacterium TaxID=33882 RepID=UPI00090CDA4F|nr:MULTISPECIES: YlxR family protein [unclassified Microbacterium]APH44717.1 nucleic-acid-binding protein [Microbacterium sp. 1.5R]MDY0982511.1 YlxR family protein [Microbacterium sp. CFBP9023]